MPIDAEIAGTSEQPLEILIVGAGFSGVGMAIKLLEKGERNFRIVEKSSGIGGTWFDNRYPGAACDVPSHFYCFSFAPNPNWSRVYSPQAEIQQYIEDCATRSGVRDYISNNVRLTALRFDDARQIWKATVDGQAPIFARFVVNAAGGLHKAAYPDIPGRERFSGHSMHTANWDNNVELTGKRVAVIGSAASAIQLIPEVAKTAAQVAVFQRTPNYIAPRNDRAYTEKEKRRFARWPKFARLYRWFIFMRMELLLFPITRAKSKLAAKGAQKIMMYMRSVVKDKAIQDKLVPDYKLGCKRILISDEFYPSLNRPNVQLITDRIDSIEPAGVKTLDGRMHEADVLVYATGFDIDGHILSVDITGEGGRRLADDWSDIPNAYSGCAVDGYPNYFMMTGPNTGVATTSVVYMVEQQIDFVLKLMKMAGERDGISPTEAAVKRYNEQIQSDFKGSVWLSGCASWYRREDDRIATLYPYNARRFRRQSRAPVAADFRLSSPRS
ncbi:MAG: NAD(P)/FAD-dependent oxidoreductase [Pseudomonadota bacterium]